MHGQNKKGFLRNAETFYDRNHDNATHAETLQKTEVSITYQENQLNMHRQRQQHRNTNKNVEQEKLLRKLTPVY